MADMSIYSYLYSVLYQDAPKVAQREPPGPLPARLHHQLPPLLQLPTTKGNASSIWGNKIIKHGF